MHLVVRKQKNSPPISISNFSFNEAYQNSACMKHPSNPP
jgi:hypothetical protein